MLIHAFFLNPISSPRFILLYKKHIYKKISLFQLLLLLFLVSITVKV